MSKKNKAKPNWNTKDNEAKLKALKRLLKEWQDKLDPYFYMIAMNIINNSMYNKK